jgi:hypothetical protein
MNPTTSVSLTSTAARAARLILKRPTGRFAAGREAAQALALLSDGAFKLYMHLCLEANRHTGCVVIEPVELSRTLRQNMPRSKPTLAIYSTRAYADAPRRSAGNL